jgi:undecaprenyl-diphosphatase
MRTSGHPSSFVERVDRIDRAVDEAWDVLRGRPALDRLFYTASELGDFSLIWHLLGTAKGLGPAGPAATVRLSAALGVESALVNGLIKSLFRRQRPVVDVPRPRRLRTPRTTSFPSGHASSAALAATLLAERSPLGPVYVAIAAVVATSRIHVRIHHASDVVAGAALGIALGRLGRRLVPLDR